MWLYYWEQYGQKKAEHIFKRDYFQDKGHVKIGEPNFKNVLSGKLEYLRMVKGANDSTYKKLIDRYDLLLQNESTLEAILNEWEQNGIEKAMALL